MWSGLARMDCSAPVSFAGTRGAGLPLACPIRLLSSGSRKQLLLSSRVLGPRARRRAGEAAVLPTHSSFAPAAEAAARLCSTPRRSVRGCRRILEEPAPSARRLLFLPTHRALFLTSCRGAEGLAPVALRSRTRSESGERLRISRTPQRNHFRIGLSAVAPPCRGALSSPDVGRG